MSNPTKRHVKTSRDTKVWLRWLDKPSSGEKSPIAIEEADDSEDDEGNIKARDSDKVCSSIFFTGNLKVRARSYNIIIQVRKLRMSPLK